MTPTATETDTCPDCGTPLSEHYGERRVCIDGMYGYLPELLPCASVEAQAALADYEARRQWAAEQEAARNL